jgi:hypothetical protein
MVHFRNNKGLVLVCPFRRPLPANCCLPFLCPARLLMLNVQKPWGLPLLLWLALPLPKVHFRFKETVYMLLVCWKNASFLMTCSCITAYNCLLTLWVIVHIVQNGFHEHKMSFVTGLPDLLLSRVNRNFLFMMMNSLIIKINGLPLWRSLWNILCKGSDSYFIAGFIK